MYTETVTFIRHVDTDHTLKITTALLSRIVSALQVTELPLKHMYVGKTHLSVNDIRSFNNLQRLVYELNENDCR